jgi:DHA2 family multidrug resistance protein
MGTGIINLARNIGASVGIATVTTMLERRTQAHQVRLIEHVNAMSAAYHNMFHGTQTRLISAGSGLAEAARQAQGMIYNTVQRQAAMLAFIDNFKMLGVVFFAVIPVLLLMRKPKVPSRGVPAH